MDTNEKNTNSPVVAQDEDISKLKTKIRGLSAMLIFAVVLILVMAVFLSAAFKKAKTEPVPNVPKPQTVGTKEMKAVDTSNLSGINTNFGAPYEVTWEDTDNTPNYGGSGKFSLTSAYVGNLQLDDNILNASPDGGGIRGYTAGQNVYAVVLGFKINVKKGGSLPTSIRRVKKDDAGNEDKFPQINRDYIYQGHKHMNDFVNSDSTIEDAKIIFVVPENENSYIFSTGGMNDFQFELIISGNRIEVKKGELKCQSEWKSMIPPAAEDALSSLIATLKNGDRTVLKSLMPLTDKNKLVLIDALGAEDLQSLATLFECSKVSTIEEGYIVFQGKYVNQRGNTQENEFEMNLVKDKWYLMIF